MALDWDWVATADGEEFRARTRGPRDDGFGLVIIDEGGEHGFSLAEDVAVWLRDCLNQWLGGL